MFKNSIAKKIMVLVACFLLLVTTIGCKSENKKQLETGSIPENSSTISSSETETSSENSSSDKITSTSSGNKTSSSNSSSKTSSKVHLDIPDYMYDPDANNSEVVCEHKKVYNTPTCEQPSMCKTCFSAVDPPLGHNFVNDVCTRCNATPVKWYAGGDIDISKSEVDQILSMQFQKPKNVIIMIGDGMGANDIALAEKHASNRFSFGLALNRIKNTGFATTHSSNSTVTDSAAGGTALATGYKTNNGNLGVSPTNATLKNISEYAREKGKKVGIVTNDEITGATPASFAVHINSRGSTAEIAKQFVKFAPDVLIGQGYTDFEKLDLRNFVVGNVGTKKASAFQEVLNKYNIRCERPFIGFYEYNSTYSSEVNILGHCTDIALNCLSKNSPNGFFLMVENTSCDSAGHANNIESKLRGVVALDRTLAIVLRFMKNNPDTLLIITSDHETGGVKEPTGNYKVDSSLFTTTAHTGANVRTFAVGYGAEYFNNKTVDNTDIAKFAIDAVKG